MPTYFELVLPVRFKDNNGNLINTGEWLPVINFFSHLIDQIKVNRKGDGTELISHVNSGSVGRYIFSLMQHMTMEQLKVIEKGLLFIKTPVTGVDILHRVGQGAIVIEHELFRERIRKFTERNVRPNPVNADKVIPLLRYDDLPAGGVFLKNNLTWGKNK